MPQNSVKADQRHLVMSKKEILRIIDTLLEEELKGFGNQSKMDSATREAFVAARVRPSAITVNFSGGITKICWNVTHRGKIAVTDRKGGGAAFIISL